jgi:translation initiation factor IF-2
MVHFLLLSLSLSQ